LGKESWAPSPAKVEEAEVRRCIAGGDTGNVEKGLPSLIDCRGNPRKNSLLKVRTPTIGSSRISLLDQERLSEISAGPPGFVENLAKETKISREDWSILPRLKKSNGVRT